MTPMLLTSIQIIPRAFCEAIIETMFYCFCFREELFSYAFSSFEQCALLVVH